MVWAAPSDAALRTEGRGLAASAGPSSGWLCLSLRLLLRRDVAGVAGAVCRAAGALGSGLRPRLLRYVGMRLKL
eukprot:gene4952-biopygen9955